MPDTDIAITVEGVSKCYRIYDQPWDRLLQMLWGRKRDYFREFWALRDLSFEIRRGETVGVVGRNGAGKSTLLQLISGTLSPTNGNVRVNGRVAALLELGAGFNSEFTGRENVILNAMIFGLTRAEVEARMDDILAFADIGNFVDQPVKTYSSGMYLRLAFSVIAHVDADILMVDEALAVGDAVFTQRCMRFLRRFQETGTMLFVSHDTGAVVGLCQKAIWLDRGKLRMNGATKEVTDSYLAFCVESEQGESRIPRAPRAVPAPMPRAAIAPAPTQERAQAVPQESGDRIEFFDFDPDAAGFGQGSATIASVELLDKNGQNLLAIGGGEHVVLRVRCTVNKAMTQPIVGFYVKDRLGQFLFGENSYVTYRGREVSVGTGETMEALFGFDMPFLPRGDYSICIGVAEGTQAQHVMHHWIHDALLFKSHSFDRGVRGLVGIPVNRIELGVVAKDLLTAGAGRAAASIG